MTQEDWEWVEALARENGVDRSRQVWDIVRLYRAVLERLPRNADRKDPR
jgi:hypothetical protein